MRVGFLRRIGAFLLDLIPIAAVLTILFQFLVGDILKPENYDNIYEDYQIVNEEYYELGKPYATQLENEEITQDEYNELMEPIIEQFYEEEIVRSYSEVAGNYLAMQVVYFTTAFTLIYYVYSGVTKGSTLGRRICKIELTGEVNWWTLLLREVIWKTGYYMLTLGIGGLIIDFFMIAFTAKKKAPRDYISKIDVKYEGVDYPF